MSIVTKKFLPQTNKSKERKKQFSVTVPVDVFCNLKFCNLKLCFILVYCTFLKIEIKCFRFAFLSREFKFAFGCKCCERTLLPSLVSGNLHQN